MNMTEEARQWRLKLWLSSKIVNSDLREFCSVVSVVVWQRLEQHLPAMIPLNVDMGLGEGDVA
jgi:hypothetical protein